MEERLAAPPAVIRFPPLGGQHRTPQERGPGTDEGREQDGRPLGVLRARQGKSNRHGGIERHVAHDIEIAAEGCRRAVPCDGPVDTVDQPVEQNKAQGEIIPPEPAPPAARWPVRRGWRRQPVRRAGRTRHRLGQGKDRSAGAERDRTSSKGGSSAVQTGPNRRHAPSRRPAGSRPRQGKPREPATGPASPGGDRPSS